MTAVLIATSPDEVRSLLAWAQVFSVSHNQSLTILLPQRKSGQTRLSDLPESPTNDEPELVSVCRSCVADVFAVGEIEAPPPPQLTQVLGETWTSGLPELVTGLAPSLLLLPAPSLSRGAADDTWQQELMSHVDCDVVLLRDDNVAFETEPSVGVILSPTSESDAALRTAIAIHSVWGGTSTAIYVEPDVGDYSAIVARRQLQDVLKRSVGRHEIELFQRDVVVAAHPGDAVKKMDTTGYDLLILGSHSDRQMRQFLRSDATSPSGTVPAVALLRPGASLGNRVKTWLDRRLKTFIPQLSREDKVGLVTRIQNSSQWDFDFVLLISLATLIACLGLAENSGAVIVGAMLVAPLMTPIAGVGLGVAHANIFLTNVALRTALRGFSTALLLGICFGLFVQLGDWIGWLQPLLDIPQEGGAGVFPPEMDGRMKPQFYDLLIALVGGIAAAYAMGRPNLYSALPGVAIAAALVPPIATAGIAISYLEFGRGTGALLLFFTNMVTIILGAALVFQAVGVRSQKEGPAAATWPRSVLLLLVALSVLITIVIEWRR